MVSFRVKWYVNFLNNMKRTTETCDEPQTNQPQDKDSRVDHITIIQTVVCWVVTLCTNVAAY